MKKGKNNKVGEKIGDAVRNACYEAEATFLVIPVALQTDCGDVKVIKEIIMKDDQKKAHAKAERLSRSDNKLQKFRGGRAQVKADRLDRLIERHNDK